MKENEEISEGLSIKNGGGLLTLPVVKGFIEFALYKTEKTTHIKSFYVACFVDLKRIAFCTQQTIRHDVDVLGLVLGKSNNFSLRFFLYYNPIRNEKVKEKELR